MRTFDYRKLSRLYSEGELGRLAMTVHEDKGRFDAMRERDADVLEALRSQARFDSVDASSHCRHMMGTVMAASS